MDLAPEGVVPADDPEADAVACTRPIEAMVDEGRFEDALVAIDAACRSGQGNPLDLLFLRGDAHLGMGNGAAAEVAFRELLAQDPDCVHSRYYLAQALYMQWDFVAAEAALARAMELPDVPVHAFRLRGLLEERANRYATADEAFRHAAAVAPDQYCVPFRLTRAKFDSAIQRAVRKLPRQLRKALERVPVMVMDLPDESLMQGDSTLVAIGPDLLGMFVGVPLPDSGDFEQASLGPNKIYLFQRNLERDASSQEELVEQIEVTLYHELAHYLGFEEEDMEGLGLD